MIWITGAKIPSMSSLSEIADITCNDDSLGLPWGETTIEMFFLNHRRLLLRGCERKRSVHGGELLPTKEYASVGSKKNDNYLLVGNYELELRCFVWTLFTVNWGLWRNIMCYKTKCCVFEKVKCYVDLVYTTKNAEVLCSGCIWRLKEWQVRTRTMACHQVAMIIDC
jgi:hypothetical protein